jgi:hypothetical protein
MTEQRWERLVHRLEGLAARKPAAYRLRVWPGSASAISPSRFCCSWR